jgi:hypothetical protein
MRQQFGGNEAMPQDEAMEFSSEPRDSNSLLMAFEISISFMRCSTSKAEEEIGLDGFRMFF